MKQKNFPGRKFQRQQAADRRAEGEGGVKAGNVKVPDAFRSIRTKKDRS